MLRRLLRILLPGGLLFGLVIMVRRTMSLRSELEGPHTSADRWTPIPIPDAVATAAAAAAAAAASAASEKPAPEWLPPQDDGSCPPTHLIKAKATSHLYHLPGMFAYDRAKPDRCYAEEAAAAADGFTRAKR
jgi:hypothetical protein